MNEQILISIQIDDFLEKIKKEFKTLISEAKPLNQGKSLPTLLTREETSQLLKISLPTLSDYSKNGIIPSYRIGGKVRYKEEEVLNSLELVKCIKYQKGLK